MRLYRKSLLLVLLAALPAVAFCAEGQDKDSLVRLISAKSAELLKIGGRNYRKVTGPARFLHNNTYLICDSALWNVDDKFIDCMGHVQLAQEGTLLTSDNLHYIVDSDLAQFRGGLVELKDKKNNCMRTRYLDYNTKDSIGLFYSGASMRDEDGNLIESLQGRYDGKASVFTFERNVEFFSDTLFLKTSQLIYDNNSDKAFFSGGTNVWRNSYFLNSADGWYNRKTGDAFFTKDVYGNDPDYEVWGDSLYFSRDTSRMFVEMNRDVAVLDTARQTAFFGHKFTYLNDSANSNRSRLSYDAAVIYFGKNESDLPDSLYMRADTMEFSTKRKCDMSAGEVAYWDGIKTLMFQDPIGDMRKEKAKAYAEKMAKEYDENRKYMDRGVGAPKDSGVAAGGGAALPRGKAGLSAEWAAPATAKDSAGAHTPLPAADSLAAGSVAGDSSVALKTDSTGIVTLASMTALLAGRDTVVKAKSAIDTNKVVEKDTTMIGFMMAVGRIKAFRKDMQLVCDSLYACSLDSIATVYKNPALWQDSVNQLTSDSMRLLVHNDELTKGNMMSNCFIISQEDSIHFNQIKSTEMIGHFRDNHLVRYDALGGASAVFFLAEHGELTTVNIKESKMLSSDIKDNQAQRMYYFDTVKSDAYPLVVSDSTKERLKDFKWRGAERPVDRFAVTSFSVPRSERLKWVSLQQPQFPYSNQYFPGYMNGIRVQMAKRAEENRKSDIRAQIHRDSLRTYAGLDDIGRMLVDDSIVGSHLSSSDKSVVDSLLSAGANSMLSAISVDLPLYRKSESEVESLKGWIPNMERFISDSLLTDADRFAKEYERIADSLEVADAARKIRIDSLVRVHRDSLSKARIAKDSVDKSSGSATDDKTAVPGEDSSDGGKRVGFFRKFCNFFRRLFGLKPLV